MPQKFSFDADVVRQLAELLNATDLNEIEYAEGDRRVRVVRHQKEVLSAYPMAAMSAFPAAHAAPPAGAPAAAAPASNPADHPGAVKSPMVGTVYLAPEAGAAPFVKVGDQVSQGQTLLIVEAMKVMNPIRAPHAGRIAEILVKDAEPVEFGEALLIIE